MVGCGVEYLDDDGGNEQDHPSSALTSAIPDLEDRGAFMSINASLQQIAGGIAAAVAGKIVIQRTKFSPLENYDIVGYVIVVISILSIFLMYRVSKLAAGKGSQALTDIKEEVVMSEGV
ncbi:hypothetical protein [Pedobacter sp. UC225_65]|uniref:hypothetical protein n=1 Tax=Pedobacter sp. UC225_65 TaxID=3350173 RepID=UPI00366E78B9